MKIGDFGLAIHLDESGLCEVCDDDQITLCIPVMQRLGSSWHKVLCCPRGGARTIIWTKGRLFCMGGIALRIVSKLDLFFASLVLTTSRFCGQQPFEAHWCNYALVRGAGSGSVTIFRDLRESNFLWYLLPDYRGGDPGTSIFGRERSCGSASTRVAS